MDLHRALGDTQGLSDLAVTLAQGEFTQDLHQRQIQLARTLRNLEGGRIVLCLNDPDVRIQLKQQ